jgi:HlyD family secretion protein
MKKIVLVFIMAALAVSCKNGMNEKDASGIFEADEIVVSSEVSGRILQMNANEGVSLSKDAIAAVIDTTNLLLQKEQVEASINALSEKTNDPSPYIQVLEQQLSVQQTQLNTLEREKIRLQNLLKEDAATGKQMDDMIAQIDLLKQQMTVTQKQIIQQKSTLSTQNRSILSEKSPLEKKVMQVNDLLKRSTVMNPVSGNVLTKYAEAGEITAAGKPLYKIADLSTLTLRAYISGAQLSEVKLNQTVKVFVDNGADNTKEVEGTVNWISDKAEFTPKTIQTKDERANLVYAVKIGVKNDGFLKIGMYGEIKLK